MPPRSTTAELAARLRQLRSRADLTLVDAAQQSAIDCRRLQRIESGAVTPTADEVGALSALFGISVDELIDGSPGTP